MNLDNKKILFLISLGSLLEFYDFGIFIYLAPLIGKTLIPVSNPQINLLLSYSIFFISAFCRPFGGLIFAHLGDTRGRKYTFVYTILLMSLPTLCIALIPSASVIGLAATAFLVFFRIAQGFALGGEIPGSVVFGYELSSAKKKAFNAAFVIMGTNIGFFLSSAICTLLISLHIKVIESWRIAFLLGGLFGLISYFLRRSLVETPAFSDYKKLLKKETAPVKLLFAGYKKPVLQLLGISCFFASTLAVFSYYMPNYLAQFYHLPLPHLMKFNSYTVLLFVTGSLLAGIFDHFFGKFFFLIITIALSAASVFLFLNYGSLTINEILCCHSILLLALGTLSGRFPVLAASFFPVAVRYTGVSFVYNISFGVVSGSTQMLLTWLIQATGIVWIPLLYVCFFAFFMLLALTTIRAKQFVEYSE